MMALEEVEAICSGRFAANFTSVNAPHIVEQDGTAALFALIKRHTMSDSPRREFGSIVFRASYLLEYIYFNHPEAFSPHTSTFVALYTHITDGGAKRHFAKMMSDWLQHNPLPLSQYEAVAEATALWIIEPNVRTAVQIWAIEVLFCLHNSLKWVDEILQNLLETLSARPTPAINVRLKIWRKRLNK